MKPCNEQMSCISHSTCNTRTRAFATQNASAAVCMLCTRKATLAVGGREGGALSQRDRNHPPYAPLNSSDPAPSAHSAVSTLNSMPHQPPGDSQLARSREVEVEKYKVVKQAMQKIWNTRPSNIFEMTPKNSEKINSFWYLYPRIN